MAAKWSITGILLAGVSPIVAYQSQNSVAHFLWPQIPDSAVPYPGGIFETHGEPPPNNHTKWGMWMYPIAAVGSWVTLRYTLGTFLRLFVKFRYRIQPWPKNTYIGIKDSLIVNAPKIVQNTIPVPIALNFAVFAKVFRDGPGERFDEEFYRTGDHDPRWDWVHYSNPLHDREHWIAKTAAASILEVTQDAQPFRVTDPFLESIENPKAEQLESKTLLSWSQAQLGYNTKSGRHRDKEWRKIRDEYDPRLDEDEPVPIETLDGRVVALREKKDPHDIARQLGEFDKSNPIGRLPIFGNLTGLDEKTMRYSDLDNHPGGIPTQKQFLKEHDEIHEKFTPNVELETLKSGHRNLIRETFDEIYGPYKTPGVVDLNEYSLEKRLLKQAQERAQDDDEGWESYYNHPQSIVSHRIPKGAQITANAWNQGKVFSNLEELYAAREREKAAENAITPLQRKTDFAPRHILGEIQKPFSETLKDPTKRRQAVLHQIDAAKQERAENTLHPSEIPGMEPKWVNTEAHYAWLNQVVERATGQSDTPHKYPAPRVEKGMLEHRHEYYTGRGRAFAEEPNHITGDITYDPNVIPPPPAHLELTWDQNQEYYLRAKQIDYDHARKLAGSIKENTGKIFPKFKEPEKWPEEMAEHYPHLGRLNKRLDADFKFMNSLEQRVLNPPGYDILSQSKNHPHLQQPDYILNEEFNPSLYNTSLEYRQTWDKKYPQHNPRALGIDDTKERKEAEKVQYLMDLSYGGDEYANEKRQHYLKTGEVTSNDPWSRANNQEPILISDYYTDRFLDETFNRKATRSQDFPERQYHSYYPPVPGAQMRKELKTPAQLTEDEARFVPRRPGREQQRWENRTNTMVPSNRAPYRHMDPDEPSAAREKYDQLIGERRRKGDPIEGGDDDDNNNDVLWKRRQRKKPQSDHDFLQRQIAQQHDPNWRPITSIEKRPDKMTQLQREYKWETDGYEFKDRLRLKEDQQHEKEAGWRKPIPRQDSRKWQQVADDPTLPDGRDPIKDYEERHRREKITRDGHYYNEQGEFVK